MTNHKLKKSFEQIMHPAMFEHFDNKYEVMKKTASTAWLFYEASLILELERKSFFDFCVVVVADEKVKITRLNEKRNISESDSRKIMQTQMPDNEKITHADYVIDNSTTLENLEESANKLLLYLREKFSSL